MNIDSDQILDYRVRQPLKDTSNPPLLFLLHGYGSHEEDLFSFANALPENYLVISLRAPIALGFGGYAWYSIHFNETQDRWSDDDEARASQKLIMHNINYHQKQFGVKTDKVSLLGFSQGAILSWAVGLSHPEKIDKIIALSGYVNTQIFDFSVNGLEQLRCFSSHGTEDPTLPVDWARKGIEEIKKHSLSLTYKEYPMGHGINPENFSDLLAWLKANP